MADQVIDILIVDDNPDDVLLLEEALKFSRYKIRIYTVENGEKAVNFLQKKGPYHQVPLPRLIFLDLKLPGITGTELLEFIKKDKNLAGIVVVIFTSSILQEEKKLCYDLNADLFLSKPYGFVEFKKMINKLEKLFFSG